MTNKSKENGIRKKEKGITSSFRVNFPFSILLFPLIFLLSFVQAFASVESATLLFQKGNQSYDEGKFDQAIQEYEKILDFKIRNFQVFYNLGNAYFRQNQLGKAILSYHRALALKPGDEDAQANLAFVKLFTLDKIEEQQINLFSNLLLWYLNLSSKDGFALLSSFFYILSIVMGIRMLFLGAKKYLLLGFLSFLILFLICGSSLWTKIHFDSQDYGVVIVSQVEVRSGPGQDYVLQLTGHEGLELRVDEEAEGWYRISLPNGIKGWIPKQSVEII